MVVGTEPIDATVRSARLVVVAVRVGVAAARNRLRFAVMRVGIAAVGGARVVVDALFILVAAARNVMYHAAITLALDSGARVQIVGTLAVAETAVFDRRQLTQVSNALGARARIGRLTVGLVDAAVGHIIVDTAVLIATIVGARIVVRTLKVGNAAVGNHLVFTHSVHTPITGARFVIRALRVARALGAASAGRLAT